MAKHELRVSFEGAPAHVASQIYGNLKHRKHILKALQTDLYAGQAHEKELFHWLNTDDEGGWLETISQKGPTKGQKTVPVPMSTLRGHLSTMLELGDVKKIADGRYALPGYEPENDDEPEESEEDESGEEVDED
jgi:hypothetical protein